MGEVFLLSALGSVLSLFPLWRTWTRSVHSGALNVLEIDQINTLVTIPRGFASNFQSSTSVSLSQQELTFIKSFIQNPSITDLTTVPPGILEKMASLSNYRDAIFSELPNQQQTYLISEYIKKLHGDQILLGGGAHFQGQVTYQPNVSHNPATSANNGSGGGGDMALLFWCIMCVLFMAYNAFRIYTLKGNKDTKSHPEF